MVAPAAILSILLLSGVSAATNEMMSTYVDQLFIQDYSEQIPVGPDLRGVKLLKVRTDRNGRTLVLSDQGLLQVHAGALRPERQYRPLANASVRDMDVWQDEFVYLTEREVLSNARAGRLLAEHQVPGARLLVPGRDSDFLVIGDGQAVLFRRHKPIQSWEVDTAGMKQAVFDGERERYLLLTNRGLELLGPVDRGHAILGTTAPNCLAPSPDGRTHLVGTCDGYFPCDPNLLPPPLVEKRLPCANITCIRVVGEKVWFGTVKGAFARYPDGQIDYYASRRWLVDDAVVDIWPKQDGSVLILSEGGLSIIHFEETTLARKAAHFDRLTRQRHIRHGFNSAFVMSTPGDLATGTLIDQDNDGLWTAMYLAGELFRYAVTKSDEALRNCYESFEALERLSEITPMAGFPARSFERAGYQVADKSRWHVAEDQRWAWKGTTSSDEIVGHFFVYAIFAELAPDEVWRQRAVALMDAIMDHIVRNDWYLVDYDGQPTQWGRWHPEYVNQFPRQVGDRRLNSAEIIAFLQTAWHFTGKEVYRAKAFELLEKHGYLDNIMIPIKELGRVPGIDLTTEWNHSDDELAFLSYWNLYRYAFTPELREQYRRAITDHWEVERPEKNPLWNFIYAATGARNFDMDESIWTLKQFPLDTVSWTVRNSHRQDIERVPPNFRDQSTRAVLPPDERPMSKYNGNAFRLDGGNGGRDEFSGDIYLLPYWMGRYLGIIR